MTAPADLILTNAAVHPLTGPDGAEPSADAVAVRDGWIVRVGRAAEVAFLEGVETTVIDCEGRVVLPGFVDAHTHMETLGRHLVHADLSGVERAEAAISRLADHAATLEPGEWVLGYSYDESGWDEPRYLTREDLDRVSTDRPVVAFREDMHTASVNSVVLERHREAMPETDVRTDEGTPTGVLVETAVDTLYAETSADRAETRELVTAARDFAHAQGVTAVHDMVRNSHAPQVYRELDREGALDLRVRLNYWTDHLDGLVDVGETTGWGSDLVQVGAVKSYTDGSFGGRTAKLTEPYEGATDGEDGETGQWVVEPDELAAYVERADGAGLQFCAHAIGDAAVAAVLDAYGATRGDVGAARHRVEHAELLSDDLIARLADLGAVASVQPNFLKWAREGGLYEDRLGTERTALTNRFRDLLDAGVPLAFGSDCMPLGPLFGVEQAVTAPASGQRLSVTEALRAYTSGAAYAAFDEAEQGTVEVGTRADLVVLADSPWTVDPEAVGDIAVDYTVVDGRVVYRRNA